MTDEEKKAVENLKTEYEKLIKEDNILFPLYKSDAKRLINLIEKQSKEIEELKKPKYLLNAKTGEITTINNSEFISKDKIKGKLLEPIREEANKINKIFFEKDKGFEVEGTLLQELGAIEGMILKLLEEE